MTLLFTLLLAVAPEQIRADFATLYANLQEAQYDLHAHVKKEELDKAFREERFDRPLTIQEIQTRFQKFVAKVRVAHTRIALPTFADKGFPLDVRIDGGRMFVTRNFSGIASPEPGEEITQINGTSVSQWLKRFSAYVSADTEALAHSIIEYKLGTLLRLELGARDSFDVVARNKTRLPARLAPKPTEVSDARASRMLESGVAYLRPGPFYNTDATGDPWDNAQMKAFIDASFADFLKAKAATLLIDLRNNPGGDGSFSDPMVAWFATRPFRFVSDFRVKVSPQAIASNAKRSDPVSKKYAAFYAAHPLGSIASFDIPSAEPRGGERFTGKVYVLIDRYTYSNAANVAAIVQDYDFGTVIGEETTDLVTTYGAMEQFNLPLTGIRVGFAKAFLIRPNGDLQTRGVVPDLKIETPVVQQGDEVLAHALRLILAPPVQSSSP